MDNGTNLQDNQFPSFRLVLVTPEAGENTVDVFNFLSSTSEAVTDELRPLSTDLKSNNDSPLREKTQLTKEQEDYDEDQEYVSMDHQYTSKDLDFIFSDNDAQDIKSVSSGTCPDSSHVAVPLQTITPVVLECVICKLQFDSTDQLYHHAEKQHNLDTKSYKKLQLSVSEKNSVHVSILKIDGGQSAVYKDVANLDGELLQMKHRRKRGFCDVNLENILERKRKRMKLTYSDDMDGEVDLDNSDSDFQNNQSSFSEEDFDCKSTHTDDSSDTVKIIRSNPSQSETSQKETIEPSPVINAVCHKYKSQTCPICAFISNPSDKKGVPERMMKHHMNVVHPSVFFCQYCNPFKVFPSADELKSHFSEEHCCPNCFMEFTVMTRHSKEHHPVPCNRNYPCIVSNCRKKFVNKQGMQYHVRQCHPHLTMRKVRPDRIETESSTLTATSKLNNKKVLDCPVCVSSCASRSYLLLHMKLHHPNIAYCRNCTPMKVFQTSEDFTEHFTKEHRCPTCFADLTLNTTIKHPVPCNWILQCLVDGCKYKFRTHSARITHVKNHHVNDLKQNNSTALEREGLSAGSSLSDSTNGTQASTVDHKQRLCPICGYICRAKEKRLKPNLVNHIGLMHPTVHPCPYCLPIKVFATSKDLETHNIKEHHCANCGATLVIKNGLSHPNPCDWNYPCMDDQCNRKFLDKKTMRFHAKLQHRDIFQPYRPSRPIIPPSELDDLRSQVSQQERETSSSPTQSNGTIKRLECPLCVYKKKGKQRKSALIFHIRTQHPNIVFCYHCLPIKVFDSAEELQRHQIKQHCCPNCHADITSKNSVNHPNPCTWNLPCGEEGCSRKFRDDSCRIVHLRRHKIWKAKQKSKVESMPFFNSNPDENNSSSAAANSENQNVEPNSKITNIQLEEESGIRKIKEIEPSAKKILEECNMVGPTENQTINNGKSNNEQSDNICNCESPKLQSLPCVDIESGGSLMEDFVQDGRDSSDIFDEHEPDLHDDDDTRYKDYGGNFENENVETNQQEIDSESLTSMNVASEIMGGVINPEPLDEVLAPSSLNLKSPSICLSNNSILSSGVRVLHCKDCPAVFNNPAQLDVHHKRYHSANKKVLENMERNTTELKLKYFEVGLPVSLSTTGSHKLVCRDPFIASFNYDTRLADYSAEWMNKERVGEIESKAYTKYGWEEESTIELEYRVTNNDYKQLITIQKSDNVHHNDQYHRGKLVSNVNYASNWLRCRTTWNLVNAFPQNAHLNRMLWGSLEAHCRELALRPEYKEVFAVSGINNANWRTTVVEPPNYCWKAILLEKTQDAQSAISPKLYDMECYFYENKEHRGVKFNDDKFRISLARLEQFTNKIFFPLVNRSCINDLHESISE